MKKSDARCRLGKLSAEGPYSIENYCDETKGFTAGSQEDIIKRIIAVTQMKQCQPYHLVKNNCEHLATRMLYGEGISEQVCNTFNSIPCFVYSGQLIIKRIKLVLYSQ